MGLPRRYILSGRMASPVGLWAPQTGRWLRRMAPAWFLLLPTPLPLASPGGGALSAISICTGTLHRKGEAGADSSEVQLGWLSPTGWAESK